VRLQLRIECIAVHNSMEEVSNKEGFLAPPYPPYWQPLSSDCCTFCPIQSWLSEASRGWRDAPGCWPLSNGRPCGSVQSSVSPDLESSAEVPYQTGITLTLHSYIETSVTIAVVYCTMVHENVLKDITSHDTGGM